MKTIYIDRDTIGNLKSICNLKACYTLAVNITDEEYIEYLEISNRYREMSSKLKVKEYHI